MRKYYLDNIRWATVVIVMLYHVIYIFNHCGVAGGLGPLGESPYPDILMYVVYPWFMVLLFLVAGICSRHSLEKRTAKQFISERAVKLLVPSTIGLFVYQWILGYFNVKASGALDQMPAFIRYPVFCLSGTGPLWFSRLLFLFSLLLVLIRKIDSKDKFYNLCSKCNTVIIILFGLLIWGSAQILNMPIIEVYRFGIYFTAYLLGYFVFSHDEVMERVEKIHLPMLIVAIAAAVGYTIFYFGKSPCASETLKSVFTNLYLWAAVLAILGCAKKYFDKTSPFADYMSRSSSGFYIIHYSALMYGAYFLYFHTTLPVPVIYVLTAVLMVVFTVGIYELFRRIPFIRWAVLGIKKKKKEPALKA